MLPAGYLQLREVDVRGGKFVGRIDTENINTLKVISYGLVKCENMGL